MAKYRIKHNCGHVATHDIVGPEKGRESQADYLETTLCKDCYRAQQDKKANDTAAELNLPELTGSEKQVKWAVSLRQKNGVLEAQEWAKGQSARMDTAEASEFGKSEKGKAMIAQVRGFIEEAVAHAISEASAKWWIDNRFKTENNGFFRAEAKFKALAKAADEANQA